MVGAFAAIDRGGLSFPDLATYFQNAQCRLCGDMWQVPGHGVMNHLPQLAQAVQGLQQIEKTVGVQFVLPVPGK